ncbi:unnamed protein product [Boreogadus saida]
MRWLVHIHNAAWPTKETVSYLSESADSELEEDPLEKGPALCLDFQRGAAFYTFQKGPALYLPFPRGSAIQTFQTFQKGPSLYLAFVFADASTSPSSSPMPATCGSSTFFLHVFVVSCVPVFPVFPVLPASPVSLTLLSFTEQKGGGLQGHAQQPKLDDHAMDHAQALLKAKYPVNGLYATTSLALLSILTP